MDSDSKSYRIIQKLAKDGWVVDENGDVITPKGYKRKLKVNTTGYFSFNVRFEDACFPVRVHQLSAYLKFGEEILDHECIRHLDGNCLNNAPSNMKLGSHSKNAYDRHEKDRLTHAKKAAKVLRKFSDDVVLAIRNSTKSLDKLADEYGCAKSTISGIKNRKVYRDV